LNTSSTSDLYETERTKLEDTILKLMNSARHKIKLSDFTKQDKYNLIDLFVNNETTYKYIFNCLFNNNQSLSIT